MEKLSNTAAIKTTGENKRGGQQYVPEMIRPLTVLSCIIQL